MKKTVDAVIFDLDGTLTDTEKYYQEGIYWNFWDLSERAKYPEKFTVDLKNKNLSSTANWTDRKSVV